jgi:hypothetical protein
MPDTNDDTVNGIHDGIAKLSKRTKTQDFCPPNPLPLIF